MNPMPTEWTWLDARATITLAELTQVSGLSLGELNELMDYGALVSLTPDQPERVFSAHRVTRLRKASQLRRDFDLDLFAVAILMEHPVPHRGS